jgi:hypothetical protein
MQRRYAIGLAAEHVELVHELVHDHVESLAAAARFDLAPRQDHRPLLPCFAG